MIQKRGVLGSNWLLVVVVVIAGLALALYGDKKAVKAEQESRSKIDSTLAADPDFKHFCDKLDTVKPGDLLRLEFTNSADGKVSSQIFAVVGQDGEVILVYANPKFAEAHNVGQLFASNPRNKQILYRQLEVIPQESGEYQFAKIVFDSQK